MFKSGILNSSKSKKEMINKNDINLNKNYFEFHAT